MAISHSDQLERRRLRRLSARHHGQVEDFFRQDLAPNLFALSWLSHHGLRQKNTDTFGYWGIFDDGDLEAVCLAISQRLLMVDARRPRWAEAMGTYFKRRRCRFSHLVSRPRSIEPFWRAYQSQEPSWPMEARLIQEQRLYELRPRDLAPLADSSDDCLVRLATARDLDPVFFASIAMHREETLENPMDHNPQGFRHHVENRIGNDRTYVWFDDRRHLLFKADVSTRCRFGAQVSGVYTSPKARNRGLATRGLHRICEELFAQDVPRITLYVNRSNRPARRVYEKLGFLERCPYQTVFVARK